MNQLLQRAFPWSTCSSSRGFAASKGEAKRLIKAGGTKVNDVKVEEEAATVTESSFPEGKLKLSKGKKDNVLFLL